ncbi:MAG: nitrous oxide reductase accessory protein NosL [Gemmatimonadetes bacterium]|nr:nitrous oxide reductase accessory protein NosL [Gemmatimonadota bacterium]
MRRLLLALSALALGCGSAPRVLVEGESCGYCRMAITDTRFGGQVVLTTGRTRSFDAIECLVGYLAAGTDSTRIGDVLVSDFESGQLVDAATAVFVRDGTVASPMGRSVIALASGAPAEAILARYGGTIATWDVMRRDLASAPPHAVHHAGTAPAR